MTELAIILPVVLLLLMGVYAVSELISVQNTATTGTRNGARLASELGNGGWNGTGTPNALATATLALDDKIVSTVATSLTGTDTAAGMTLTEIDIYRPDPARPPGYFSTSDGAMLLDRYNPDGTPFSGWTAQYTLDKRNDVLGNESQVGVRVVYTFKPAMPFFQWLGNSTRAAYTVMLIQPL